jgi:hypothetical protein
MPLSRVLMLFGLTLLPVGLIFGMSTLNGGNSKVAMFTELACLGFGAAIFMLGHRLAKKDGEA